MTFTRNEQYAREIGARYGAYVSTFRSDTNEVSAELFRDGDTLVAYVSFAEGLNGETVRDRYFTPLREKAADLGFEGRFQIIYVEA